MRTRKGKRTAHFSVQIVEDSENSIEMFFDGMDHSPITFKRDTGRSGPGAFAKMLKIIEENDEEG